MPLEKQFYSKLYVQELYFFMKIFVKKTCRVVHIQ